MGASGINWRNVPHEEIVDQINGGAGVSGISDLPSGYRYMAETLRRADADLRQALAAAGASWEGVASDGMQSAATPLAQWAEDADQLASESGQRSSQYGDEYATTRTGMPAPVPIPSGGLFEGVISRIPGVTTDREEAEAAADAAHEEAAARMEAYDNASYATVQTHYFSAPPQVVLEIAPSAGGGEPGITGGSGSSIPASTPGSSYVPPGGYPAAGGSVAHTPSIVPGGSPTAPTSGGQVPAPAPTGPYPGSVAPTSPAGSSAPGQYQPGGVPLRPGTTGSYPAGGGAGRGRPGDSAAAPPVVPGGQGGGSSGRGGFGGQGGSSGFGGHGAFGAGPGGGDSARGGAAGKGGFNALGPEGGTAAGRAAAAGMRPGGGAQGSGAFGPMGAASGPREEDGEHRRPDYLVETEDVWGDGTRVAPPVIGDRPGP
jgi:PPE family